MKKIILLISVQVLFSFYAYSGQLYMWTDKKGITHVSDQPPKEDTVETDTIEYKEMRETDLRQEKYKNDIQEIKKSYDRKLENLSLEMRRNKNVRVQDNELKRKLENERRETEIESAKKQYDYLKSNEEKYRKCYHNAKRTDDREYCYSKMREIDEARSNLMTLQNKK